MSRNLLFSLMVLLLSASYARSLEIIAPLSDATLSEGKIVVIGTAAPGADKGKATFAGQTTTFKVRDGGFSVVLNLPKGAHEVVFSVGEESAKLKWKVDPAAKAKVYSYHPGLDGDKCSTCHVDGKKITREDQVVEICERCHKHVDKAPVMHGPVAMGLCAACHDSHGSFEGKFLRAPTQALCEDCHNQPVSDKHRKAAGNSPCIKCHEPHGSSKQYMLR